MPFNLGPVELGLILLIVAMLFGVGKLPEVFGAVGKGVREFRKEAGMEGDQPAQATPATPALPVVQTPVAAIETSQVATAAPVATPVQPVQTAQSAPPAAKNNV